MSQAGIAGYRSVRASFSLELFSLQIKNCPVSLPSLCVPIPQVYRLEAMLESDRLQASLSENRLQQLLAEERVRSDRMRALRDGMATQRCAVC